MNRIIIYIVNTITNFDEPDPLFVTTDEQKANTYFDDRKNGFSYLYIDAWEDGSTEGKQIRKNW